MFARLGVAPFCSSEIPSYRPLVLDLSEQSPCLTDSKRGRLRANFTFWACTYGCGCASVPVQHPPMRVLRAKLLIIPCLEGWAERRARVSTPQAPMCNGCVGTQDAECIAYGSTPQACIKARRWLCLCGAQHLPVPVLRACSGHRMLCLMPPQGANGLSCSHTHAEHPPAAADGNGMGMHTLQVVLARVHAAERRACGCVMCRPGSHVRLRHM